MTKKCPLGCWDRLGLALRTAGKKWRASAGKLVCNMINANGSGLQKERQAGHDRISLARIVLWRVSPVVQQAVTITGCANADL